MNAHAHETSVNDNVAVHFGKYVLHRRIGAGGMAEVWLATLPGASGIDKPCVVKRILPRHVLDDEHVKMFLDEARISISLQQGNIVPVLDFGEVDGTYYLAMDWVDGRDLWQILRRARRQGRSMPLPVALFVAIEMCRGLAYAHDKVGPGGALLGLVHRDVSPGNVLCSWEGDVKIADFGIAKARARFAMTQVHQLKGKAAYMSPEQARGEPVDARTDQFATGIVLYEMLTGVRPHDAPDKLQVLEQRRAGQPCPPPSERRPDLSAELDAIVLRALAPTRGNRYEGMRELQIDLAEQLHRVAPRTTAADLTVLLRELFPRHRDGGHAAGTSPAARLLDDTVDDPREDDQDHDAPDDDDADLADPPTAEVALAPAALVPGTWNSAVDHAAVPAHVTESLSDAPPAPPPPASRAPLVATSVLVACATAAAAVWFLTGAEPAAKDPDVADTVHLDPAPPSAVPAPAPPSTRPALTPEPDPASAQPEPDPASAQPEPDPASAQPAPEPESEPDTAPAPSPPSTVPARGPTGRLEIVSVPWAEVWVDGRRRAESTPVTLRLPAGVHQVRLSNPELGLRRNESVEIRAGTTTRLAARLR